MLVLLGVVVHLAAPVEIVRDPTTGKATGARRNVKV
jgi:hypothetical protein